MSSIRFLTPTLHGVVDYAAATGLIVLPFIFGFGGLALWLSVAGGAGLIGYSLLTDYAFGAASLISFKTHLTLDLAAATAFVAAPLVFGWGGLIMGYYRPVGIRLGRIDHGLLPGDGRRRRCRSCLE